MSGSDVSVRADVPIVVARLMRSLGPPLVGREMVRGRWQAVWRFPCPACGGGEDDAAYRPLVVSGAGWIACTAEHCDAELIAMVVELRELPAVA